MTQINFITKNNQNPISTRESYLTSPWNSLTNAAIQSANFVSSKLYAVYDFPRSTNPVTQQREFRWIPTWVEQAIGTIHYPKLLKQSGRVIRESDKKFGEYSKLVHKIGKELVLQCPRKDLEFEFKVVKNREDNAWCLAGGKIAINLGLIINMEEEKSTFGMRHSFTLKEKIAAVLSHEITHAAARHTSRTIELLCFLLFIFKFMEVTANFFFCRYFYNQIQELEKIDHKTKEIKRKIAESYKTCESISKIVSTFFDVIAYNWILHHCTLCTSRSQELEADKYGMHLIHKVGREDNTLGFTKNSAESAVWIQHYFQEVYPRSSTGWLNQIINLFYEHPTPEERLAANKTTWQELQKSSTS